MKSLLGQVLLNRYRVDSFLGRGGMAEVYKVWDSHRNAWMAMKVLHEDLALDHTFLRRFKREAETLAHLQHPNIVRFYGLEQEGRTIFMLMDYVDGESLKHKIFDANGALPFNEIYEITTQLAWALKYAHAEGFVHSDVKPANIMLDSSGQVQLSDFGITRMAESTTMTMVGAGTPAYMSPEQINGEEPSYQTDIYALGIVLYEMLTGERPFTGELATISGTTSHKVRWEQTNIKAPPPSRWNSKIPPELDALILKALAKDKRERFKDIGEFLQALSHISQNFDLKEEKPKPQKALQKKPFSARTKKQVIYKKRNTLLFFTSLIIVLLLTYFASTKLYFPKPDLVAQKTLIATKAFGHATEIADNATATRLASDAYTEYVVKRGESLASIAQKLEYTEVDGVLLLLDLNPEIRSRCYGEYGTNGYMSCLVDVGEKIIVPRISIATPTFTTTSIVALSTTATEQTTLVPSTPTAALPEKIFEEDPQGNSIQMRLVSAGEFLMGQDYAGSASPAHTVFLDTYYIDRFETTNKLYQACVEDGVCTKPINQKYYVNPVYENHPVVYIKWEQAKTYCEWRNVDLPSEAQWEKAARGTDGRTYPWGNEINCDRANYNNCIGSTTEVGSYPRGKSPYEVHDMTGNALEWVDDKFVVYEGNTVYYRDSMVSRVLRGGSWIFSSDTNPRAYSRTYHDPTYTDRTIGFRCAKSE